MIRPVQFKQEFLAQIYFAGTKAGKVGSVIIEDKGSSSLKLGHFHVLSWGFLLGLNQFAVLSIVLGGGGRGMWDSCHAFTDQTENLELCSNRLEIVSSLVRAGRAFITAAD